MAMNILLQIKKAIRRPDKAYRLIAREIKEVLLWDYYYAALRSPKTKSVPPRHTQWEGIIKELKNKGFNVIDFKVNLSDYKEYINNAEYHKFPLYRRWMDFPEKSLEHYLAAKFLGLSKNDIYIDIGNAKSPTPQIYHKLYGCTSYRQDLIFPKKVNGDTIGGDAGNMPVEDGFATKMALHCSFEHFEQDADIRFIKEANRVLRKNGRLCIVPLYLSDKYAIITDPAVLPKGGLPFERDAILYCRKGWRNRHGRLYDVPHLIARIKNNLTVLKLSIYVIQNEKEVNPLCYVKFAALFEKE